MVRELSGTTILENLPMMYISALEPCGISLSRYFLLLS
jgi:hypothetical protein